MPNAKFTSALVAFLIFACSAAALAATDANRLTYLDGSEPYYVSRTFPKLVTPQWIGEPGVDAVVILAIDDMRDPARYEAVLRPAIDRLKQVEGGRAPISIMTCRIDPKDQRLARFLAEGLSLEVHTIDHPCPILAGGDFARAKRTYDDCVDMMDAIPGNHAVAFRTPCCDSKNTLSPRLLSEIFNSTTSHGRFLQIDSSVFHRFTANDPALPRELVLDQQGGDRYARYVPFPSFANSISDYPYPYVIGRLCWEFPCITPSDWQSHNIQGDANPRLLADWEAQLNATVIKKGVFTLVFHPYGWSKPQQLADLVDYAATKYGKRVKFLTFRDALERINKNLLDGQSLRAGDGSDNGVRLLDVNDDGYLDVVIGNGKVRKTRVWAPGENRWIESDFPCSIVADSNGSPGSRDEGVRFGVVRPDGAASMLVNNGQVKNAWSFVDGKWIEEPLLRAALDMDGGVMTSELHGRGDLGVRLRDIEHEGRCDVIVSRGSKQAIYGWDAEHRAWAHRPPLPEGTMILDEAGRDAGLRFVDVDGDGYDDIIYSNEKHYALDLYSPADHAWSRRVMEGVRKPGDQSEIPAITRDGTNNGAWFMRRTMWVQNEDTATLPDLVERRTFNDLLAKVDPPAKSPEASLKSISVKTGFTVELMAKEPVVEDPIAFAWGGDGRFWVVEMGDYPLGVDGKGKPGGRIKILESTHHDGHYDKATVFLDNLSYPTGVMPWGRGVLVTDAPEIFYAEDTKHDGHCDYRKTLFTGFGEGNQQHRMNGLLYGLDNWVHGANGNSGGRVRSAINGQVVNISGRDFRIKPDEGLIETETGQSQYGHTCDDWGTWFGCDNTNPMYQYVLDDHYLRRNRYLTPPNPRSQVSDTPGAAAVFPTSRTMERFNDPWGANHFTSANSVIVYRDDLFGPAFIGNSFVSEPVHDLVHREIMRREGILYHSKRADDKRESEFWASNDNWTRPTMLRVGPDGALWIADMYRYVIEHPEWIPKDWQARLDLRAGHDKGRIYRVYPVGVTPRPIPVLEEMSMPQLVQALDSPSGWQRDLAQQLLVQMNAPPAVPLLEKLARESTRPTARLQALCTLDGLKAVSAPVLISALADSEGGVRRNAIRLCEGRFNLSPEIADALLKRLDDPDAQVRLQLAYTLGEWDDPRAASALSRLMIENATDQYILAAAMSSISTKNVEAIAEAVARPSEDQAVPRAVSVALLKMCNAMGQTRATARLLAASVKPATAGEARGTRFAAMGALVDALEAGNSSLTKLADKHDAALDQTIQELDSTFEDARGAAGDHSADESTRASAIRLIGRGPSAAQHRSDDLALLASLLSPREPDALQQAAIDALGHIRDPKSAEILLSGWKSYGPALRARALDALLGRREWLPVVLDAIEHRQVRPIDIDAPHRHRLLQIQDAGLRQRAQKLLAETINPDRQKVIDAFAKTLSMQGSRERGHTIFARLCVTCHRLNNEGNSVGPDLAGVGDKSTEGLMISILDPNRAVEPQFVNYVAETNEGQTISGVLRRESGNSVTLALPGGTEQTLLRSDLKSLRSTGLSLMPEGLEAGLSPRDLADLISYVQGAGGPPKPKTIAGNKPELVLPSADGKLELLPSNCEIFGASLIVEKQYGNLGYWSGADDRAVWAIQPARAGTYNVILHYACDDSAAGNTLVLQCGTQRITLRVEGTGNWDTYRRVNVGRMELSAGRQHLTARAEGNVHVALLDLRAIELAPAK